MNGPRTYTLLFIFQAVVERTACHQLDQRLSMKAKRDETYDMSGNFDSSTKWGQITLDGAKYCKLTLMTRVWLWRNWHG